MSFIKTRPNDGTEEEKEENNEENELEEFLEQAEKQRKEKEEEEKKRLEQLKKERTSKRDEDEEAIEKEQREGLNIELKKVYMPKRKIGVFNRKGQGSGYGTEKFNKTVEKSFRQAPKRMKEQTTKNFMQLFDKYHRLKGSNISSISRDEIIKFEAGLRRGSSDEKFTKLCNQLKKEGIIKNSADVKKFFSKRELKSMRNSLTGQKDNSGYTRTNRNNPTDRGIDRNNRTTRPMGGPTTRH